MGQDLSQFKALRDGIRDNDEDLLEIDLTGKNVGDSKAVKLAQALRHNDVAEKLILKECDISHVGITHLCDTLCSVLITTNIRVLVLDNNPKIGSEGGRLIGDMLKNNSHLEELSLNACGLGDLGLVGIAFALHDNLSLTLLELGSNGLKDEAAEHIAAMLKENTKLEGLSLFQNLITGQGAKCIAEGLSSNRTLTWLGLGKNFLGVEGAWALSDGLRANRGLQWLAVGGNSIGDRGVTHLATLISGEQESLLSLGLGDNAITDDGAVNLAEALKRSKKISSVGLENNHIGLKGASAFAGMLRSNRYLKTLVLSGNRIGDNGGLQLAMSLGENRSLDTLHLADNPIGEETMSTLAEVLTAENTTLQRLDLRGTAMSKVAQRKLQRALQDQSSIIQLAIGPSSQGGHNVAGARDQIDGGGGEVEGVTSATFRQGMRNKQSLSGLAGDMEMY